MELGVSDTTDLVQLSDVEDADLAALGMNKVEIGRMRRMLAEAAAAPPASMYVQGDDGLSAGMMDGLPLQQMGSPTDSWTGQQPSGAGLAPVAAHPINIQRVKHMCSGGQMLTGCAVLMNIVLSIVILNSQGSGTSCDKAPEHDRYGEPLPDSASYGHGYMGAALAIAGGCLGAGYGVRRPPPNPG